MQRGACRLCVFAATPTRQAPPLIIDGKASVKMAPKATSKACQPWLTLRSVCGWFEGRFGHSLYVRLGSQWQRLGPRQMDPVIDGEPFLATPCPS